MDFDAVTLLDQNSQLSRINIGILLLLFESKRKHFALEFYGALTARLLRKKGPEPKLAKSLLNLIEAFPAEAELPARLCHRISVNHMGAQHFIFDLGAIARVEEIHLEKLGSDGFRMRVQRTGS